jgi:ferredoxin
MTGVVEMAGSGYLAEIDAALCANCDICVEACPFRALAKNNAGISRSGAVHWLLMKIRDIHRNYLAAADPRGIRPDRLSVQRPNPADPGDRILRVVRFRPEQSARRPNQRVGDHATNCTA